jgi:AbrB family looped-hinge helix DNA binding protein
MPANVRQLITRHCRRILLAGIGQRWLEVERVMGIEHIVRERIIVWNHCVASADGCCVRFSCEKRCHTSPRQPKQANDTQLTYWLPRYHFFAIIRAMKTTIDSAGRIVVPKSLRQALNIKPGQTLDIRAGDGRLEIEIAATPMTLKKRGKDVVAVPDVSLPTLTADAVRETLEHIRR